MQEAKNHTRFCFCLVSWGFIPSCIFIISTACILFCILFLHATKFCSKFHTTKRTHKHLYLYQYPCRNIFTEVWSFKLNSSTIHTFAGWINIRILLFWHFKAIITIWFNIWYHMCIAWRKSEAKSLRSCLRKIVESALLPWCW